MLASRPSLGIDENDASTRCDSSDNVETQSEHDQASAPPTRSPSRVLITGASGFVGSATTAHLKAAEVDVIATSRPSQQQQAHGSLAVDATSIEAMTACIEEHRPTHLLMLAWPTDVGTRDHTVFTPWLENIVPVMRAFAANGGQRFIGVGSCMEYDWDTPGPLSETTPLNPGTEYGKSKAAAFEHVSDEANLSGLSWGWARPFFLYGPREPQRRLIPDVVTSLLKGEEVRCTEGLQYRDFLHIDDVGAAIAAFATSEIEGPMNIASGKGIQVRQLVEIFADRLGRPDLVKFGARPLQGYEAPEVVADVSTLHGVLGFSPSVPMDTGVDATIEWWRRELLLTGEL